MRISHVDVDDFIIIIGSFFFTSHIHPCSKTVGYIQRTYFIFLSTTPRYVCSLAADITSLCFCLHSFGRFRNDDETGEDGMYR